MLTQSAQYHLTPSHLGRGKGIALPTLQLVFRYVDSPDKTFPSYELTIVLTLKLAFVYNGTCL